MAHADIMGQLPRVETVLYSLTPQSGIGSYAKNHCEFKRATKSSKRTTVQTTKYRNAYSLFVYNCVYRQIGVTARVCGKRDRKKDIVSVSRNQAS